MRNRAALFLTLLALSVPGVASAQPGASPAPGREIAISVGPAHLSHGDDPLGWGSTVGVSFVMRMRGLKSMKFYRAANATRGWPIRRRVDGARFRVPH